MLSYFQTNSTRTSVPEWSSFFNEWEYAAFIKEIDNYFSKLSIRYEILNGQVITDANEFGEGQFGLLNVAQLCKQVGLKNYRDIISRHFSAMTQAGKSQAEFAKIAEDFEEAKSFLGVRLYNDDYIGRIGKENTVGKNFAGDIFATIVFDLPDCVMNIKPSYQLAWNKSVDELIEIGTKNIRDKYPYNVTKHQFDQFSIWLAHGDHFFTPNIVFDLENRKELVGAEGSLVGLPHRHSVIIYPIESSELVLAINYLIPAIYGINKEGPGSLSNQLFWYREKTFIPLPYTIEGSVIDFYPTNEFGELLKRLR